MPTTITEGGALAEAPCEQVIDMLGDVAPAAVADPDERRKLAYLLARSRIRADERAEQFQGALSLFLAEPADEQLQSLPRCHSLQPSRQRYNFPAAQPSGCWWRWQRVDPGLTAQCRRSSPRRTPESRRNKVII